MPENHITDWEVTIDEPKNLGLGALIRVRQSAKAMLTTARVGTARKAGGGYFTVSAPENDLQYFAKKQRWKIAYRPVTKPTEGVVTPATERAVSESGLEEALWEELDKATAEREEIEKRLNGQENELQRLRERAKNGRKRVPALPDTWHEMAERYLSAATKTVKPMLGLIGKNIDVRMLPLEEAVSRISELLGSNATAAVRQYLENPSKKELESLFSQSNPDYEKVKAALVQLEGLSPQFKAQYASTIEGLKQQQQESEPRKIKFAEAATRILNRYRQNSQVSEIEAKVRMSLRDNGYEGKKIPVAVFLSETAIAYQVEAKFPGAAAAEILFNPGIFAQKAQAALKETDGTSESPDFIGFNLVKPRFGQQDAQTALDAVVQTIWDCYSATILPNAGIGIDLIIASNLKQVAKTGQPEEQEAEQQQPETNYSDYINKLTLPRLGKKVSPDVQQRRELIFNVLKEAAKAHKDQYARGEQILARAKESAPEMNLDPQDTYVTLRFFEQKGIIEKTGKGRSMSYRLNLAAFPLQAFKPSEEAAALSSASEAAAEPRRFSYAAVTDELSGRLESHETIDSTEILKRIRQVNPNAQASMRFGIIGTLKIRYGEKLQERKETAPGARPVTYYSLIG